MCCDCLCGCLYDCRSCLNKLLTPLMILDLGLTIYILVQLFIYTPFACCTDNLNYDDCSFVGIGGADNVGVQYFNESGYCYRLDTGFDCSGSLGSCAQSNGVDIYDLCNEDVLEDVAQTNWQWLIGILVLKCVGLCFMIFVDIKTTYCDKKDAGEQDSKDISKCCLCQCTKNCCRGLIIFCLRVFFLIFGTGATLAAIYILKYTDRVSIPPTCKLLDDYLEDDCNTVIEQCTDGGDESYYNVIWSNVELEAPYVLDLCSSVLSAILWVVRFAVFRYYTSHLTKV